MRDAEDEPNVNDDAGPEPVEAMVAMALAWGVPAEVVFGEDEPQ